MRRAPPRWEAQERDFLAFHRTPLNATLHLLTTPLGLLGVLGLTTSLGASVPWAIALVYGLSLIRRVPLQVWMASTLGALGLAGAAVALTPSVPWSVGLVVAGYALQSVAHKVSRESTYDSTYSSAAFGRDVPRTERAAALSQFAVHTWLLLPLVLAAIAPHLRALAVLLPRVRVVDGRLTSAAAVADVERIRAWIAEQQPSREHTTHWWFADTPPEIQAALHRLADDDELLALFARRHPGHTVEVVAEMNEIYVAGPETDTTSDTVFYTSHVDGPYAVWPGASVYRGLLALTDNTRVQTRFVLPRRDGEPLSFVLTKGDFLAFDFNREPHYIRNLPDRHDAEPRSLLKIHYVVYPQRQPSYGRTLARLTGAYDRRARALFVSTLTPSTWFSRTNARIILAATHAYNAVTRLAGWANLAYVGLLGALSVAMGSMLPLLIGASFVHYLLYLGVFAYRESIDFGRFRRDAAFFKLVALGQLAGLYLYSYSFDPWSLTFLLAGYGLAGAAYTVLGDDRTWFGAELGHVSRRRITTFPYGVVPHPMIVGSIVGLVGFYLHQPLRELVPWLVPMHIAMYLLHLVQEISDEAPGSDR